MRSGRRLGMGTTLSSGLSRNGLDQQRAGFTIVQMFGLRFSVNQSKAALHLGVSTRTLTRWKDSGRLAPIEKQGVAWSYDVETVKVLKRLLDRTRKLRRVRVQKDPNCMGVSEAARFLGISRPMIYEYVRTGKLRAVLESNGRKKLLRVEVEALRKKSAIGTVEYEDSEFTG